MVLENHLQSLILEGMSLTYVNLLVFAIKDIIIRLKIIFDNRGYLVEFFIKSVLN